MAKSTQKTILVASAGEPHGTRRALAQIRTQYPDHQISLLILPWEERFFTDRAGLSHVYVYDWGDRQVWKTTQNLLRELRPQHFDLMVIVRQQGMRTVYGHFLSLVSLFLRIDKRVALSDDLSVQPLNWRSASLTLLDLATFVVARPVIRLLNRAVFFVMRALPERASPRQPPRAGAIAFLVPVLPDLSHTFVYREVLSILEQHSREQPIVVVSLEQGSFGLVHEEARQLLGHAFFVPEISLTRYLLLYTYFLLTRPRRIARLVRLFADGSPADPFLFLRREAASGLHPSTGLALARLLEREGVSYIHCHGMSYPATRGLVASELLDVPFSISTFVDFDYPYPFKCLKEKLEAARFVITCTAFCRTRLLELTSATHAGKIHVIHHALDPSYANAVSRVAESQPQTDAPAVFAACRFVEKKGLEYLVEACAVLKRRGVPVRVVLVGDGEERTRLERLVEERDLRDEVSFRGALRNDEVWRAVGPDDICVVPSVYCDDGERDGIPVFLLEALVHRHAVVSTQVSGIPELITSGVHGLLVPERDAHALADAIETLVKNKELRLQLAAAGQARVLKDFAIADKTRMLWDLIRGTSSSPMPERPASQDRGRVDVIIVNYNGARFIAPLFDSLAKQTYQAFDVWFFDNGSTDGSCDLVTARHPEARVVSMGRNAGYSVPVNEGIRRSTGDYLLILNADVVLNETFLEEMVRALEEEPAAGWVAAKILKLTESGTTDEIDCLGHHMARDRYAKETDYSRPFDWVDYSSRRYVFGASACAALYRRTMLNDIALNGEYFDEDFFAYFEDVDIDWRAQQRGWKCIYTATALAHHMRGGSGLIRQPRIAACYLANRWLMLLKNDEIRHLAPDVVPVLRRLARDFAQYGRRNPAAIVLAFGRFARYAPKMLGKRRAIKRRRVVARTYLRGLIR